MRGADEMVRLTSRTISGEAPRISGRIAQFSLLTPENVINNPDNHPARVDRGRQIPAHANGRETEFPAASQPRNPHRSELTEPRKEGPAAHLIELSWRCPNDIQKLSQWFIDPGGTAATGYLSMALYTVAQRAV
jgi:hypothetical protein